LEYLISSGARVNLADASGMTAVMMAAGRGHEDCLRALLVGGEEREDLTGRGVTVSPIHLAVMHGSSTCVEELAAWGANLDVVDGEGNTVLSLAVEHSGADCVEFLLSAGEGGVPLVNANRPSTGLEYPLHLAARRGDVNILRALLRAGADPARLDARGATPSHVAANFGHGPALEVLSQAKALRSTAQTSAGETPTFLSAQQGHVGACQALKELGAISPSTPNIQGVSPLLVAAMAGHKEVVELLAEAGGDVNLPDSEGTTPGMAAALQGNRAVLRALICWGATFTEQDHSGQTATHFAAMKGHTRSLDVILSSSEATAATAGQADNLRRTPLWIAAAHGRPKAVSYLLRHIPGACNDRDSSGATALWTAAERGHVSCVKLLLQAGADPDAPDEDQVAPVLVAAQEGHEDCLRELLAAGADVGVRDEAGNTAAAYATMGGHLGCLEGALMAIAEVDAGILGEADKQGCTAAHCSAAWGQVGCLQALALAAPEGALEALNADGETALHVAARVGQMAAVVFLLEDADLNGEERNCRGETPSWVAVAHGKV
ncbi:unnamed protein product, partial [Discosporangium mesarthrocarpum]